MNTKLIVTTVFLVLCSAGASVAQKNPVPDTLILHNYVFDGFDNDASTKYPKGMWGWSGQAQETLPSDHAPTSKQATGDAALLASTAADLDATMKNEGDQGMSIRGSHTAVGAWAIVLALNTEGCAGLVISFTVATVSAYIDTFSAIELQYRIGSSGNWTNVDSTKYSLIPGSESSPPTLFTKNLPDALNNRPLVQFRWQIYGQDGVQLLSNTNRAVINSLLITKSNISVFKPVANFDAAVNDYTVTFTDKSTNTPNSWLWNFGDDSSASTQNPIDSYAAAGTYTVKLRVANVAGADTITKNVVVDSVVSVADERARAVSELLCYPNPVRGELTVVVPRAAMPNGSVELYTMLGVNVRTLRLGHEDIAVIDLSGLPEGIYGLRLVTNKGSSERIVSVVR